MGPTQIGAPSRSLRYEVLEEVQGKFWTVFSLKLSLYCTASAAFSPPRLVRSAQAATSLTQGDR